VANCIVPILSDLNFWLASGTWALALVTLGLYCATRRLVSTTQTAMQQQAADARAAIERQSGDLRADLSVRLHMMMEEKWDSERMAAHRSALAKNLLENVPHREVTEQIMDFFEIARDFVAARPDSQGTRMEHVPLLRLAVVDGLQRIRVE
jgi:hypothetical protein